MIWKAAIAVLATVLLLGGASAAAQRATATTKLTFVDFADSNADGTSDYIIGKLSSPRRKCIGGRMVKIFRLPPGEDEFHLVDRDRSSRNGFWAGGGFEEINSQVGKVTVERKVIRRPGGRLVCRADSEPFD